MDAGDLDSAHLFLYFAVGNDLGQLKLECLDVALDLADDGALASAPVLDIGVDWQVASVGPHHGEWQLFKGAQGLVRRPPLLKERMVAQRLLFLKVV